MAGTYTTMLRAVDIVRTYYNRCMVLLVTGTDYIRTGAQQHIYV